MRLKYAVSLLSIACASATQAQVITFETEVMQVACTPDLNSSGATSAVIPLSDVKVSAFADQVGATAGETMFTIGLSSCGDPLPANTVAGAYFHGQSANKGTDNLRRGVYKGRLTGTSSDGGSGWQYQLLPGAGSDDPINVFTSNAKPKDADLATLPTTNVSLGSGMLTYRVRYYRVGKYDRWGYETNEPAQINPGTRTAEATYVLYYQ